MIKEFRLMIPFFYDRYFIMAIKQSEKKWKVTDYSKVKSFHTTIWTEKIDVI